MALLRMELSLEKLLEVWLYNDFLFSDRTSEARRILFGKPKDTPPVFTHPTSKKFNLRGHKNYYENQAIPLQVLQKTLNDDRLSAQQQNVLSSIISEEDIGVFYREGQSDLLFFKGYSKGQHKLSYSGEQYFVRLASDPFDVTTGKVIDVPGIGQSVVLTRNGETSEKTVQYVEKLRGSKGRVYMIFLA